jgi:segregation and condensation protein B
MNESYIRNVLEAALLAAGRSLQLPELIQLFDENVRPQAGEVRAALDALAAEYSSRGIEVKETAAGFRIQVRREFGSEISRLWPERPARYSRALLETLALIAYRQPITRGEIEAVRGVAVNPNILKTVIERNWVRVVGHRDVPGRPELLGTTREFLDYFGLRSLDELPPLAELKAMGDINLQLNLSGEPGAASGPEAVGALANPDSAGGPAAAAAAAAAAAESVAATACATGEAGAHGEDAGGDAEADRTLSGEVALSSGDGAQAATNLDDGEAAEGAPADDSAEAPGESSSDDDAADDDELSADGHGSRELVAAPRDVDD